MQRCDYYTALARQDRRPQGDLTRLENTLLPQPPSLADGYGTTHEVRHVQNGSGDHIDMVPVK